MSADKEISTNIKLLKEAEWDDRKLKRNYSELLEFTDNDYIPRGFTVTVIGEDDPSKMGLWFCIDNVNLSNPLSWINLAKGGVLPWNQIIQIGSFSFNNLTYIARLGETTDWAFSELGKNYVIGDQNVNHTAPDATYPRVDIIVWSSADGYQVIEGIPSADYDIPNTPPNTILTKIIVRNVDGSTEPIDPPDLSGYVKYSDIAADSDLETQVTPIETRKIISLHALIYFWNWVKSQVVNITGSWQIANLGVGIAGNIAAFISLALNTASVGQLYIPPSAVDYTGTIIGMLWNNGGEIKFLDNGGIVNRFLKLYNNEIFISEDNYSVGVNRYGDFYAVNKEIEANVYDVDLIEAITSATYTNNEAIISVLGKTVYAGQKYYDETTHYMYEAWDDNKIFRR